MQYDEGMGLNRWIRARIGRKIGNKVVGVMDDKEHREQRHKTRNLALGAALVVVAVLLIALTLRLVRWALGLLFFAAVLYLAWAFIRPRVTAHFQARRVRRQAREAEREAEDAHQSRARRIEDELEAIKHDMGE